jgi:hypothetical protein
MDANEMIVRRYVDEVVNDNRIAVIDEIFDTDYVNHTPGGDLQGRDAMKAFLQQLGHAPA